MEGVARSNHAKTAKSILSTIGSVAAAAMVARSFINDFIPHEIRRSLFSNFRSTIIRRLITSDMVMIIEECDGLLPNHVFFAASLYLGARTKTASYSSVTRLKVRMSADDKQLHTILDRNEEITDQFEGIKFYWTLRSHETKQPNNMFPHPLRDNKNTAMKTEVRSFHLRFNKKYTKVALDKYLPHVVKEAEFLNQQSKPIQLFTAEPHSTYASPKGAWNSVRLNHPATFETIAMDWDLKEKIIKDLERFVARKDYYRRVGKAWKRGYLLYGPPGTGKSSLIAAIANYLKFDVYDLELSALRSDSDLRKMLLGTENKSIIVLEDIDCSISFQNRAIAQSQGNSGHMRQNYNDNNKSQVTLSGLLNFMDGLWSSCGDERIVIFTTNHTDKLDPALLRAGRMDLHIHLSYCTPCGFNLLAYNYLGIKHHELFTEIEGLVNQARVTPAEVAEQLMRHEEPDAALTGLLEFLKAKKVQIAKVKAKKTQDESKAKKLQDEPKLMETNKIDEANQSSKD